MVLSGAVIFSAVFVAGAAFQFWAQDASEVQNAFTYGGVALLEIPSDALRKGPAARGDLAGPARLANWLPALYVLGRGIRWISRGGWRFFRPGWRWRAVPWPGWHGGWGCGRIAARGVRRGFPRGGENPATGDAAPPMDRNATGGKAMSTDFITLDAVEKVFHVRRRTTRLRRETHQVRAVDTLTFTIAPRRDGRLHRPERRRQVDHDQDADRHPRAERRRACGSPASCPSRERTRAGARGSASSSASAPSSGGTCRCVDSFELLRHIYRVPAARYRAQPGRFVDLLDLGRLPATRRSPALARPAHARRSRGRAAARPRVAVPGRADDRPRRGREGSDPRLPARAEPRARRHRPADHARPGRHRAALLAADGHRPRPADYDGALGRDARAWADRAHAGGRPGAGTAAHPNAVGAYGQGCGRTPVAGLPGRRLGRAARRRDSRRLSAGGPLGARARYRGRHRKMYADRGLQ